MIKVEMFLETWYNIIIGEVPLSDFRNKMSKNKLYLIKSEDGFYKIGLSNSPRKRLRILQVGNPHKLKIIGVIDRVTTCIRNKFEVHTIAKLEWALQERLSRFNVGGEWFKFDKGREQNIVMFFNGRHNVNLFKERESIPDFDNWKDYLQ